MTKPESAPVTATSMAELLEKLNGQPFYLDQSTHVPGETLPDRLWDALMAESTLMQLMRRTQAPGSPPRFHLWMLGEVMEGRLPVPKHTLIDAAFDERQLAAGELPRSEENPEGSEEMQRYRTFGTHLYYLRFPERCELDDERRAALAVRFERLTSEGYRVPELEAALRPSQSAGRAPRAEEPHQPHKLAA